jgi:hypothetical protein
LFRGEKIWGDEPDHVSTVMWFFFVWSTNLTLKNISTTGYDYEARIGYGYVKRYNRYRLQVWDAGVIGHELLGNVVDLQP